MVFESFNILNTQLFLLEIDNLTKIEYETIFKNQILLNVLF